MRFYEKTETKEPYIQIYEEWKESVGLFLVLTVILQIKPELRVSYINPTRTKSQRTTNRCCNLARFVDNTIQHSFRCDSRPELVKTDAVVESKAAMVCVKDRTAIWLTANLLLSEVVRLWGFSLKISNAHMLATSIQPMPIHWKSFSNCARSFL